MVSDSRSATGPEWARRITGLRQRLGWSQAELARQLNCSAMSVSRWERGVQEPPAEWYIQLGNLANVPECWYFWGEAGLSVEDIRRKLRDKSTRAESPAPKLKLVFAGAGPHVPHAELATIPLLPVNAGTLDMGGDPILNLDQVPPEAVFALPNPWLPNPAKTICLRVRGNSMAPLIRDGYVIAVDQSMREREDLIDSIIVVWNKDTGLVVSRLQKFDGVYVLSPGSPEYQAISMGHDHKWRVIGKVLWWMGKP